LNTADMPFVYMFPLEVGRNMKTLYELCVPRPETLAGSDVGDVQELDQLLRGQIDPNDFLKRLTLPIL